MNLVALVEKLKSKAVKRASYGVLVVLVVVAFFIHPHEIHFFGDKIPGFWSLFGLIACILIIVLSKWIGHRGLMKDEEYYDK